MDGNRAWGGRLAGLLFLMLLFAGCRTTQPDLKPAKKPEVFNPPPASVSANNSYPKQAFEENTNKRFGVDPEKIQQAGVASMTGPANFGGPGGMPR